MNERILRDERAPLLACLKLGCLRSRMRESGWTAGAGPRRSGWRVYPEGVITRLVRRGWLFIYGSDWRIFLTGTGREIAISLRDQRLLLPSSHFRVSTLIDF